MPTDKYGNSLWQWVNEWFYAPGVQTPQNDRWYCFIAAVNRINGFMTGEHVSRDDRKLVFDLLTYLLLGWNPITAWPKASDYPAPDNPQTDKDNLISPIVKNTLRRLMNFEIDQPNKGGAYQLLDYYVGMCERHGRKSTELFIGEHITMLTLALWLLDMRTNIPANNLGVIRACLDLHYRSRMFSVTTPDTEYASTKSDMNYTGWVTVQINKLLERKVPADELLSTTAYIGWFASLIKAHRMISVHSRVPEWKQHTEDILTEHVSKMKQCLHDADMKFEEVQNRDESDLRCKAKLFRLFRGSGISLTKRYGNKT